ncbi:MAG: hypothetical protein JWQ76_4831 [Ramlibacter sp.]|nr:hypothetical protein [Ramlibacter sp.]
MVADHASPRRFEIVEDNWREVCSSRIYHCAYALCKLAQRGIWPSTRWREAFQAWSDQKNRQKSWALLHRVVREMPDAVLEENAQAISWWLQEVSSSVSSHEDEILSLCNRLLDMPLASSIDSERPVSRAINHPVGHVTQALLNLWFRRVPGDNDSLPPQFEPLFSALCDTGVERFRHGRVVMASRLISFFRVDRRWTEVHLLPIFDWSSDPVEARAVWEGFLWSPRVYPPLMLAFKDAFLRTAEHYEELGEHAGQYSAFLTYAALNPSDGFSLAEFRHAVSLLPVKALQEAAHALVQSIEGSGEQREDFWRNRVRPFIERVWPKSTALKSGPMAEALARICPSPRDMFRD